jgi:hypothetical protein
MSCYRAPLWDLRPDITSCRNVAVWKLWSCFYRAPSLTRGRVWNLQCNHSMVRVAQNPQPYFTVSETPPTWRARFPYSYPPGARWPSCTSGHCGTCDQILIHVGKLLSERTVSLCNQHSYWGMLIVHAFTKRKFLRFIWYNIYRSWILWMWKLYFFHANNCSIWPPFCITTSWIQNECPWWPRGTSLSVSQHNWEIITLILVTLRGFIRNIHFRNPLQGKSHGFKIWDKLRSKRPQLHLNV